MIIIGAYLNWYYWLVTVKSWFITLFPLIEYTKVTTDDTKTVQVARFKTKTAVADNGWNRATCLDAALVYQWTTEAYWILI